MSELSIPNLIITVQQGTGKFKNDVNGNPIEESSPVLIYAAVKKKRYPEFYKMPGISTTDMQVAGKVVIQDCNGNWVGGKLPDFVNLESIATASLAFNSLPPQLGKFRFIPTTQSRIQSLYEAFGERIEGYFTVISRN